MREQMNDITHWIGSSNVYRDRAADSSSWGGTLDSPPWPGFTRPKDQVDSPVCV